ncbi:uncharacterized protein [Epargyreus clarus]|uniref:uncharacterized protein isoform X1 n=1 Tax=Epargyreus clarus TaxID=520877 RepID=UPI003C30AA83
MATFAELTKKVHSINNLILSDMVVDPKKDSEQVEEFRNHLMTTKKWFSRISWANKKRFLLALLADVKSIWTISLLLKSIWNCRPKDAVLSVCQPRLWSSYDQVPMDHNRTALPLSALKEVMTNDRKWFLLLEPESQATLLSELLMTSGGPILWEVLQRAQIIYDMYVEEGLQCLQECNVVSEPAAERIKPPPEPVKKEQSGRKAPVSVPSADAPKQPGQAQKDLDASLAAWNSSIKSMRDRMKLEELEMVFSDGTRKKVWKVNRPKPEAVETVDFVQLLPSEIGKKILMNLPPTQLSECARVNKYWSYLVDEIRLELTTRQKINIELEKLKDNMLRHDVSLELLNRPEFQFSGLSTPTKTTDLSRKMTQASAATSYKSNVLSFKQVTKNNNKSSRAPQKPIRNMADFNERLERRGAVDENLWKWCKNVLRDSKKTRGKQVVKESEGIIPMEGSSFPCPLMKHSLRVPLNSPLVKDPVESATVKTTVNISGADVHNPPTKQGNKRYSLWSKDMSGLYPVCKLPSYQFPL